MWASTSFFVVHGFFSCHFIGQSTYFNGMMASFTDFFVCLFVFFSIFDDIADIFVVSTILWYWSKECTTI